MHNQTQGVSKTHTLGRQVFSVQPARGSTMNLRQLEVFQAVMQTGNMSAAARLICITPSAVNKTVAHTELQLGYKLFTRGKGTLAPTP